MGFLALLGLLVARPVAAAEPWPAPLYAGVVVVAEMETSPAVVARSLNEAVSLLVGSGTYRVRDQDELAERLGGPPGEQVRRCEADLVCWQTVLWRGGVDVMVLLELATPWDGRVAVTRVSAWSGEGPLATPEVILLPRGGGAPLDWMDAALLQEGRLALQVAEGGVLRVDGRPWGPGAEPRVLAPGRHQVRAQFGDEVQVQVVPVLSGATSVLHLAPAPEAPAGTGAHRRWGLVAAPALAAGGVVALALQRDRPGDASR